MLALSLNPQQTYRIAHKGAMFICRLVPADETETLLDRFTRKEKNRLGQETTVREDGYGTKVGLERWKKAIVDWEGLNDIQTQQPIPCTETTKAQLYLLHVGLCNDVLEKLDTIALQEKAENAGN